METDEIPYLKAEILRLNKIINVLINQNDALNAKILHLENENGAANSVSPYDKIEKGSADTSSPYLKIEKGTAEINRPYPKIEKGAAGFISPYDKIEKGAADVFSPYVKVETGTAEVQKPLPHFIPITPGNVAQLKNIIGKKYFFRVKRKGVTAMIQILLQVHNKDGCSYTDLRRLTNRSHGGMSKLVASLKKRGLVHRTGKSKLQLGASALDYFRQANFETNVIP